MFGVSFTELLLIGAVALLIVGPKRLPAMLGTLGRWTAKLRRITTEVRYQSGIDDILRKEGFAGGLSELRQLQNVARGGIKSLVASTTALPNRGQPAKPAGTAAGGTSAVSSGAASSGVVASGNGPNVAASAPSTEEVYANVPYDRSREYPSEGCDCGGALPDDLWSEPLLPRRSTAPAGETKPGDVPQSSNLSPSHPVTS